jgi:hypothetical protein
VTGRLTLAFFVVLQLADGLMTYGAVRIFGPLAEGNPLIAIWIGLAGAGPAILGAKLMACGCGVVLHQCGVRKVLAGLTAVYLFGAVGPWLHALSPMLFR